LTRPEDVLDVAGKGVGWTSGAAMWRRVLGDLDRNMDLGGE
jgi:hypothetical protein